MVKASSGITVILLERRSKCLKRCNCRNASLGIIWILLSPKRRYWRFSSYSYIKAHTDWIERLEKEKSWHILRIELSLQIFSVFLFYVEFIFPIIWNSSAKRWTITSLDRTMLFNMQGLSSWSKNYSHW